MLMNWGVFDNFNGFEPWALNVSKESFVACKVVMADDAAPS